MTRKNERKIRVRGFRVVPYILYEFIMSLVLGVVLFGFLALVVVALDKTSILSGINALLGSSIEAFTVSKLLALSGVFALLAFFSRIIIKVLWILISNATLSMIGGVDMLLFDKVDASDPTPYAASGRVSRSVASTKGGR